MVRMPNSLMSVIDELRHICNEYKDSLQLILEKTSKIEAQTSEQEQSAYWYEVWHRCITASNVGKIACRRPHNEGH